MTLRILAACVLIPVITMWAATPVRADKKLGERLIESKAVFQELLNSPDREVPKALLENAKCVAVFPHVIKAAIGYGARRGQGVMSCRDANGHWSPPTFVTLTGGSFGLQLGAESSDLVLFFTTERGARSLITGNKFSLGGKAAVAAGPFGRSGEAATDLELKAEIYSYAKSKGLFAGLSLEGARIAPDKEANSEYYGSNVTAKQLLFEHKAPRSMPEVQEFIGVLPSSETRTAD